MHLEWLYRYTCLSVLTCTCECEYVYNLHCVQSWQCMHIYCNYIPTVTYSYILYQQLLWMVSECFWPGVTCEACCMNSTAQKGMSDGKKDQRPSLSSVAGFSPITLSLSWMVLCRANVCYTCIVPYMYCVLYIYYTSYNIYRTMATPKHLKWEQRDYLCIAWYGPVSFYVFCY